MRARLAAIVDSSNDAIISTSLTGIITSWNPGAEKMYRYSRQEAAGRPMRMLIPPDRMDEESQHLGEIARGEMISHFETVRLQKGGGRIEVSVSMSPIEDRLGRIIGASKITRDITAQKQMEKALRESEERFRSLVFTLTQIVWTADAHGHVVQPLPSWQDYSGQTDAEIMGEGWLHTLHPDDVAQTAQVWQVAVDSRSTYTVEYRLRRRDGVYRLFAVRGAPVLNEDGSIREWVGTCTDVTEQRQLQMGREQIMKDLAQSNAEWEQFGYVASHDLQEPLRAVANCVQLLQKRYGEKLDARADEFISHAVDGVRRMQTLINDLLTYSRIGTEQKTLQSTDCAALLKEVLDDLAVAITESGAKITCDAMPVVSAFHGQMARLFQNLIGNAIKFHSAHPPEIQVSAVREGDRWLFSVADNGIGIDPQYAVRIFRVFQRLHTRTHYKGTGIGLAICKKIVALHGGQIWTQPGPQGGSIFYFTLPAAKHPSAP